MFGKTLEILTIPVMILNFGGGIVGGIWLGFLGEWKLLGIGLLIILTSHWLLSILMVPVMLISTIAMKFAERNRFLKYLFGFFAQFYTNVLILATCALAFGLCSVFYGKSAGVGFVPYVLWAWTIALSPWQFLASKEPENVFSGITLLSASIGYSLFLISLFISPALALIVVGLFGITQLLVLPTFNVYLANKMDQP